MAIGANMSFLKQLEKKLSDTVTVDGMARLLSAVADVAEGFDMQEITAEQEHDDLIECFLNAMAVQGRTQKTVEAYRGFLQRLMRDIKVTARRVTVYHLRAYISALKEKGLKDSTLEGYRQRFSSFFGWLHREGLIEKNPIINLGTIKDTNREEKMEGEITRKTVLIDCLKIMRQQLAICSKNYNGLEPKDNMEEIWSELRVKVKILEDIIHAFESEPVRKAIANWQIEVMEHGPSALKLDGEPTPYSTVMADLGIRT